FCEAAKRVSLTDFTKEMFAFDSDFRQQRLAAIDEIESCIIKLRQIAKQPPRAIKAWDEKTLDREAKTVDPNIIKVVNLLRRVRELGGLQVVWKDLASFSSGEPGLNVLDMYLFECMPDWFHHRHDLDRLHRSAFYARETIWRCLANYERLC